MSDHLKIYIIIENIIKDIQIAIDNHEKQFGKIQGFIYVQDLKYDLDNKYSNLLKNYLYVECDIANSIFKKMLNKFDFKLASINVEIFTSKHLKDQDLLKNLCYLHREFCLKLLHENLCEMNEIFFLKSFAITINEKNK